jgi:rhamnosyltransferase
MSESGEPRSDVLAVVVTYNPDDDLVRNLAALRSQVAEVLVVDNGSVDAAVVQSAAATARCAFQANGENRGIAAALNQGAALALQRGATWLATFDQDSLVPTGAIEGVLARLARQPDAARFGIVAPSHRDRGTSHDYHHPVDILGETPDWRNLRCTITSGSLIRCEVLAQAGLFEERLFIDAVDLEFCMRIRRYGWRIGEARDIVMAHSIGASTEHRVLGVRMVCTHHSPLRRYYITRNMLEVCTRYFLFDPAWCAKGVAVMLSGAVASVVGEREKLAKFRAVARGFRDFGLRRFGAYR